MQPDATSDPDAQEKARRDDEALFEVLQEQVTADIEHSNAWRINAKQEFQFVAGPGQWTPEDTAKLKREKRPPVTFNKTLKFIRAVCGIEVNNRQQTTYIASDPTQPGEVKANEMASQGAEWMDAQCNALRKKSRAFRDMLICGMGWGESTMDFDDDPQGKYLLERRDPLEMGWDRNAREQNLMDAKRLWQARKMLLSEARALIPGVTDKKDEDGNYVIPDCDLSADWAATVETPASNGKTKEQKEKREGNSSAYEGKREVTIVRIQWWEFEPYYRTINPELGSNPQAEKMIDMSMADYDAAYKASGGKLPGALLRRKVYKQAFLGGKILQVGPLGGQAKTPAKEFTFHCMTGEPDDTEGVWFGLVRVMRDPQVWANKFFSQLMHIINSTAKGGILFETKAVSDASKFKESYAKADVATEVEDGAISKGRIMAKPGAGVTAGIAQLLMIANDAFGDTTGINLELMGLADRDQPGVLEAQRKQAAMTILATLFDSLTLWEQQRGRVKLYFLQNFFADGRLIRIHGDDGFKALPLIKQELFGKFDVIIDDAPTSTNMKEKAWQGLQILLPTVQDKLTPPFIAMLLDYVPFLPTKLVEGLKALIAKPDPMAEQHQQTALAGEQAAVDKDRSSAILNMANAALAQVKAQVAKLEPLITLHGQQQKKAAAASKAEPDNDDIMGQTGGNVLRALPPLGTPPPQPEPEMQPQMMPMAPPGGLVPPAGLNGGM